MQECALREEPHKGGAQYAPNSESNCRELGAPWRKGPLCLSQETPCRIGVSPRGSSISQLDPSGAGWACGHIQGGSGDCVESEATPKGSCSGRSADRLCAALAIAERALHPAREKEPWISRSGYLRCTALDSSASSSSTCSCLPAKRFEESEVIYLTAIISAFLFVYLFTALVRPEWF